MMDIQPLQPWLVFFSLVISVGSSIWMLLTSGSKKNGETLKELEKKLTSHDRRVQTLEGEIKHLPDRDSQHRMELAMVQINGRLDTLNESLKPIKATGESLNQLLLEQARK